MSYRNSFQQGLFTQMKTGKDYERGRGGLWTKLTIVVVAGMLAGGSYVLNTGQVL